jgi:hypothetical protein
MMHLFHRIPTEMEIHLSPFVDSFVCIRGFKVFSNAQK